MASNQIFNVTAKSPSAAQPHSPWHSPVPYLFGGLAAMLGLIAFALLILACSYWRLSGYLEGDGAAERDLEAGEGKSDDDTQKTPPVFEEKILVIMAGEVKPTFLATPMSSRSSSFGDSSCSSCGSEKSEKAVEMSEKAKQQDGGGHDVQEPQSENSEVHHETSAVQTH
ncbi:protein GLUTAMINE DUMPER 2-like [Juglans microcarpa x Juglans regia]|uniref:protein GLUTAMINE DUMPER 2-like n=1 Tax=Juglans microcarpa x Juglans regia TaxID=2249226 RepID=UPI001B7DD1B6|nr:protein GLUTAMINE DUMPER 2-like [Juglans microcarpa x Juglans regia]